MKVHKIDDVKFRVGGAASSPSGTPGREGELHLSTDGLLIKEGKEFFSLPFTSLKKVEITCKDPLRLRLSTEGATVEVEGTRAERIMALRALILPYIDGSGAPMGLKSFLVLWAAGIRDTRLLSHFTGGSAEGLLGKARSEGLIGEDDRLTDGGKAMLDPDERSLLRRLGVMF